MNKSLKTCVLPKVKVTKKEYQDVNEVLVVLDIPFAQLAREAIRDKIAELKRTNPKLNCREVAPL